MIIIWNSALTIPGLILSSRKYWSTRGSQLAILFGAVERI